MAWGEEAPHRVNVGYCPESGCRTRELVDSVAPRYCPIHEEPLRSVPYERIQVVPPGRGKHGIRFAGGTPRRGRS